LEKTIHLEKESPNSLIRLPLKDNYCRFFRIKYTLF
jgi:hypothetical protein